MKLIKEISLVSALALSVFLGACNSQKTEDSAEVAKDQNDENFATREGEKDADFIVDAVEGNYAEIKLAQLALSKSNDTGLKSIAMMLEQDHTKVLNELKDFAYKKGIAVPVEESKDVKDTIIELEKEEAGDFNKDWLKALTEKHENTINAFESTMDKTEDADLKSWINNTLPSLRTHLDQLTAYKEKVK